MGQPYSFLRRLLQQVILSVTMIPLWKPDYLCARLRSQKGAQKGRVVN